MADNKLELIIAIVNSGFSDVVMDTARSVGVRGGTITHCRGTANESLGKKYGVYITPDKEMVWIVASKTISDDVLKAIHEKVSDKNPGQCFVFSLPVTNAIGMKLEDNNDGNNE